MLHNIVLFLGRRDVTKLSPLVPWTDLLGALASKHPDLSLNSLRQMATACPALFTCSQPGIQLGHLNQDFVQEYLHLPQEGVTKTSLRGSPAHSLSRFCHVEIAGAVVHVKNMICCYEVVGEGGGGILFQLGSTAYKLRAAGVRGGQFKDGQALTAVLSFR